jgi:hypothetical protein
LGTPNKIKDLEEILSPFLFPENTFPTTFPTLPAHKKTADPQGRAVGMEFVFIKKCSYFVK